MRRHLITLVLLTLLAACASENRAVTALATKLSEVGGSQPPEDDRKVYVACGVKALSPLPHDKIQAALKAPDAPSIWRILGDDALNDYVRICRDFKRKGGIPVRH